jgi:hypothetical protein
MTDETKELTYTVERIYWHRGQQLSDFLETFTNYDEALTFAESITIEPDEQIAIGKWINEEWIGDIATFPAPER